MTPADAPADSIVPGPRLAYDDAATVAEMSADCRATGDRLRLDRLDRAAERAVSGPRPSLRYEDYPREVVKRDIRVSEAAARIAGALHLHLD